MATLKTSAVFRIRGLADHQSADELQKELTGFISEKLVGNERSLVKFVISIIPSCYENEDMKSAMVEFKGHVPEFLSHLMRNPLGDWQVEVEERDWIFDRHFLGFTQLYQTAIDHATTADVIAISGLDGHGYESWQGKGNFQRMWLKDFFAQDLPRCRTMVYGYNSKLSSRSIGTISDYALELLEEIKKVRYNKELRERPLFFIAHGIGGLIVVQTLLKSFQKIEDDDSNAASIYKATYAICFFGTPHRGISTDIVCAALEDDGNHPRRALLCEIDKASKVLTYQLTDFMNRIRDRKIVTFYSTEQMRKPVSIGEGEWSGSGDFMTTVEKTSSILDLPDSIEDKIPLHFDHSSMIKFDTRENFGYQTVLARLKKFEHDAPEIVRGHFGDCWGREFKNIDDTHWVMERRHTVTSLSMIPVVRHHNFVGIQQLETVKTRLHIPQGSNRIASLGPGTVGLGCFSMPYPIMSLTHWKNCGEQGSMLRRTSLMTGQWIGQSYSEMIGFSVHLADTIFRNRVSADSRTIRKKFLPSSQNSLGTCYSWTLFAMQSLANSGVAREPNRIN